MPSPEPFVAGHDTKSLPTGAENLSLHANERTRTEAVARPSARIGNALLHRDVGALQLLRDARAAFSLHGRLRAAARTRLRREARRNDLRSLHDVRVSDGNPGRLHRRSVP